MAMPSKIKVAKTLKKLSRLEGSLAPPANPTPLEKFRFDIQQMFVLYKMDHKISQREMADRLEIDESKVSKILHNRLEDFSTDRLINLYGKLNPKVQLRVS